MKVQEYSEEVRRQKALAVMEHQVEHQCSTRAACEALGVQERTFYNWLASGVLSDDITAMRRARAEGLAARAALAMPDVLEYMIGLATGQTAARGASPVAAAKFLQEVAGITAAVTDGKVATQMVFLPESVRFKVITSVPAETTEIIEAEFEDVE